MHTYTHTHIHTAYFVDMCVCVYLHIYCKEFAHVVMEAASREVPRFLVQQSGGPGELILESPVWVQGPKSQWYFSIQYKFKYTRRYLSAWKVTQWILSYSVFCLFPLFKLWRHQLRPFLTGDSNLLYSVCRFHHHLRASSIAKSCLTAIPWTTACQAPLSMGFLWQEYWSGLLFPSPGDLLDPGIEPRSPVFPAATLAGRFFTTKAPGKPRFHWAYVNFTKKSTSQTHQE